MKTICVNALFLLAGMSPIFGAPCYVAKDGSNVAPYASWENAATDIVAAVNYVAANSPGETVWIANGEYYPTSEIVVANVKVRGFSGVPADVIVDGQNKVRCFYLNHTNNELSGLTVRHGDHGGGGAGIYLNKFAVISNCIIADNNSSANGGGIFASGDSDTGLVLTDSTVRGNYSYRGGGIYLNASSVVERCEIYDNEAGVSGAGVQAAVYVCLNDCMISNNITPGSGGGIYCGKLTWGLITNCEISVNSCSGPNSYGGGIYIISTNMQLWNSLVHGNNAAMGGGLYVGAEGCGPVQNCLIYSNTATSGGGGICIYYTGSVYNCEIYSNHCGDATGGGGVYIAGNASAVEDVVLRNCLIRDNTVSYWRGGGGIYCTSGGLIQNCTITGNRATHGNSKGGGIYRMITNAWVENSIIYYNQAASYSDWYSETAGMVFSNCCVSNITGMAGMGNKTNAPSFILPDSGNYRLAANSPCINAGLYAAWMENATDLDGRQRIDRFNRLVDMGCFEHITQGMYFMFR